MFKRYRHNLKMMRNTIVKNFSQHSHDEKIWWKQRFAISPRNYMTRTCTCTLRRVSNVEFFICRTLFSLVQHRRLFGATLVSNVGPNCAALKSNWKLLHEVIQASLWGFKMTPYNIQPAVTWRLIMGARLNCWRHNWSVSTLQTTVGYRV